MTDANRRRLLLLAGARARAIEATRIADRLHQDLVAVMLETPALRRAREVVDALVELHAHLDVEIGKVPA